MTATTCSVCELHAESTFRIEYKFKAGSGVDPIMEAALGTDFLVILEVGPVQHSLAGRAFAPKAFRHRLAIGAQTTLDLGGKKFL